MKYINEGFPNERIINYRRDNIQIVAGNVYITDIGYFPVTKLHKVERKQGIAENIICFCTKGRGYVQVGNAIREVNKNEYFVIPKNISHKYFSGIEDGWGLYFVHIGGKKADDFCRGCNKIGVHLSQAQLNVIYSIVYNAILQLENNVEEKQVIFVNKSVNYLIDVLVNCEFDVRLYKKKEDLVFKFQNYLETNIDKKISIYDLIDELNVSQGTLYEAVKNKYDVTPMQYVFNMKLNIAADLLITTDYKVSKIAVKVGFDDQYHFSKKFKTATGLSPTEYRKLNIKL